MYIYSLENMDNKEDIPKNYLSSKEAADKLGYTIQHTRFLMREGKLEAVKFGRDWMVVRESVTEYKAGGDNNE